MINTSNNVIYLDYMASTPVDARVVDAMLKCLTKEGVFANPDSESHRLGWQAKRLVEEARFHVAQLINAKENEIIWTSGATEANNLALKGAAFSNRHKGRHIITCATEHKSVLDTCRFLEKEGFEVTYLPVNVHGLIDLENFKALIRPETILVSCMYVNNEIGVIQDIDTIGKLAHSNDIIFHVDAAQALGKIPIDVEKSNIDLMTFSAHKIYGPKGIGGLYIRSLPRIRIQPQMHGGGQQGGLRPGTLATHQIVALGEACRIAHAESIDEYKKILLLHNLFYQSITKLDLVTINGSLNQRVPGNVNLCFKYVDGEALMLELSDLAVSMGSACNSVVTQSSYVLKALGLSELDAQSSIRFSFGRFTTEKDIHTAINLIKSAVIKLREFSPLWEDYLRGRDA